ncbi:hypothetical protein ON010_g13179 [Phytophthora cinnamomi]|nr:hypothetical protein ON010_g13179 [Phytophthora cinnamomi]
MTDTTTGLRDGFNLNVFMASFEPGAPSASAAGERNVTVLRSNSPSQDGADVLAELRLLIAENARLKELL